MGKEFDFNELPVASVTVYAKWIDLVTVTFDVDGGSAIEPIVLHKGEAVDEPDAPIKEDYAFAGWFTDVGTLEVEYNFEDPVTEDITLYSKWLDVLQLHLTLMVVQL